MFLASVTESSTLSAAYFVAPVSPFSCMGRGIKNTRVEIPFVMNGESALDATQAACMRATDQAAAEPSSAHSRRIAANKPRHD